MGSLEKQIAALAAVNGADFCGFADMRRAIEMVERVTGGTLPDEIRLPRAVAVGVRLADDIVDALSEEAEAFTVHFYEDIWVRARDVRQAIKDLLTGEGCRVDEAPWYGLPHGIPKMAARLAGLGWIGKNSMLVTPECGPRVIWEAVLTDAPLAAAWDRPLERRCGRCHRCIDICPVGAYREVPFREEDDLDMRFDATKCGEHRAAQGGGTVTEKAGGCGLCVQICPYGRGA